MPEPAPVMATTRPSNDLIAAAARTSYASTSNSLTARRNAPVPRGQRMGLRPWSSRYQDVHPPRIHTVRRMRRWMSAFQRSWASARGSTAAYPPRRRVRIASRT